MYKFTDDLPKLTDIIDTMKPHNDDIDDTNIDDFVETIDLFLGDILVNNPQMYKEYKFYNNLTELLYDQIILLFYEPIVKYDINLDIYIKDTIDSYFIRNNCPRSYTNSIIINKPNKINNIIS